MQKILSETEVSALTKQMEVKLFHNLACKSLCFQIVVKKCALLITTTELVELRLLFEKHKKQAKITTNQNIQDILEGVVFD